MAATAPSACRKGHLVAGVMPNTCAVAAIRALGQSLSNSFQAHWNGSNRTFCLPQGSRKGHLVAGVMPNTCRVAAIRALGQSLSKSFQAH